MAKKIEIKTESNPIKEVKKGVQCVNCKHGDNRIINRQTYCRLKKKLMSAFALDCADFER
jgi:hypothetical protein